MAKDGLTKPELNLILMCDNSFSMAGVRIGQLNHACAVTFMMVLNFIWTF